MDDLGDDDFDFDLDEVVKLDSQPTYVDTNHSQSNHDWNPDNKTKLLAEEQSVAVPLKTVCEEDWGSDDDSTFLEIKEPEFQSTPFPTSTTGRKEFKQNNRVEVQEDSIFQAKSQVPNMKGSNFKPSKNSACGEPNFHSTPLPSCVRQSMNPPSTQLVNQVTPQVLRSSNNQLFQKQSQNSSILDIINKKNDQQTRLVIENRPKARFPGPAGVLNPIMEDRNKLKGNQHRVTQQLMNADGLVAWDQVLTKLDLRTVWNGKKMNLQLIKRSFVPGSFRMRVPLLIVGVQKVDYPPVIQEDIRCILQDPTGEVKGCIVKDVITTYGTQITSGSILILRRPSILQDFPTYHVLITVSSLFGMFSPKTGEVKHCKAFNNKDLASWLSESMDHGDIADVYFEKPKSPVKLFTSMSDIASSTSYPTGCPQFRSPAPNRPYRPYTPQPSYNQPRAPTFSAPRSAALTPNSNRAAISSFPPLPVNKNVHSRQPQPASSSFQFKAPSAVVTTARPGPYNPPPNRAQPTQPPSSLHSQQSFQEPPVENEEFLSQFLSGVDTDALFDDF